MKVSNNYIYKGYLTSPFTEKADIPVEYQSVFVIPPHKLKQSVVKPRRATVQPKLESIQEKEEAEEKEEKILAVQEGDDIISVDDELEHELLDMNPLGEVLSSICNYTLFVYFSLLEV